jgi:hypothetical protein
LNGHNNVKLRSWKFFRCRNDKLRIIQNHGPNEDVDPIILKKRVIYWEQKNNVTFNKKRTQSKRRKSCRKK